MKVKQTIKIIKEYEGDDVVDITKLLYDKYAFVKKGMAVLEVEASKALYSIVTETDGFIEYLVEAGDRISYGIDVIKIWDESPALILDTGKEAQAQTQEQSTIFSKKAYQILSQNNLSIEAFSGYDLVSSSDVLEFLKITKTEKTPCTIEKTPCAIGKKLNRFSNLVQQNELSSSLTVAIDFDDILQKSENHYDIENMDLLAMVIYGVSKIQNDFLLLRNYYFEEQIKKYHQFNIGIVVDLGKGVKIVKINADNASIPDIEQEVFRASKKYIKNSLGEDDLTEIALTISDLSHDGIYNFIPILPENQSAILGMSSYDFKLKRTLLTMTFDHRVMDGRYVGKFLMKLRDKIILEMGKSIILKIDFRNGEING